MKAIIKIKATVPTGSGEKPTIIFIQLTHSAWTIEQAAQASAAANDTD